MRIWINKAKSVQEAAEFEVDYYSRMSADQRIETMQYLRETWFKFRKPKNGTHSKRLRRVFKIIKQA